MIFQLIILALALSIDAFGIGVSYGFKKISFSFLSILVISFISLSLSTLSIGFGNIVISIFSEKMVTFISVLILVLLGIFIIKKGLEKEEENTVKKDICFFIKGLGLTIKIIKNPSSCDLNHSFKIEPKEAFFLGIALSVDSIGTSIAVSSFDSYAMFFPIFVVLFQISFLFLGSNIGRRTNFKNLDETKISIISGLTLVFIAIIRLIS